MAAIVRARPEPESVLERISEGNARIFVTLKKNRVKSSLDFERELTPVLQKVPDARVTFQALNGGGGGGGGTGGPISVMLAGSDPKLLEDTANKLVEQMQGLKDCWSPRGSALTCAAPKS